MADKFPAITIDMINAHGTPRECRTWLTIRLDQIASLNETTITAKGESCYTLITLQGKRYLITAVDGERIREAAWTETTYPKGALAV